MTTLDQGKKVVVLCCDPTMNDPFLSRLSTNHKSRLNIKTIKSVKAQKTLLKSEETICWLYTIYTMEDVSLFRCGDCQHGRFCLKESLAPQLYYILHVYGRDPSLAGDWIVLIVGCCASCTQHSTVQGCRSPTRLMNSPCQYIISTLHHPTHSAVTEGGYCGHPVQILEAESPLRIIWTLMCIWEGC